MSCNACYLELALFYCSTGHPLSKTVGRMQQPWLVLCARLFSQRPERQWQQLGPGPQQVWPCHGTCCFGACTKTSEQQQHRTLGNTKPLVLLLGLKLCLVQRTAHLAAAAAASDGAAAARGVCCKTGDAAAKANSRRSQGSVSLSAAAVGGGL